MKYKLKTILKSAFVFAMVALSIQALAMWTAPTSTPPGDNVAPPINTSGTGQIKNGNLVVSSFGVSGLSIFGGNVGVGITPLYSLDVDGIGRLVQKLKITHAVTGDGLVVDDGSGTQLFSLTRGSNNETFLRGLSDVVIKTNATYDNGNYNGTETMRLTSAGNVSIAGEVKALQLYANGTLNAAVGVPSAGVFFGGSGVANGNLMWFPNERSFVLGSGNSATDTVNVYGTPNLKIPGAITIKGGNPQAGAVLTSDANGLAHWAMPVAGSGSSGSGFWGITGIDIYNTNYTGKVGIGTQTPVAPLDVNGNIHLGSDSSLYGTHDMYVRSGTNGVLHLGSNGVNDKMVIDTAGNVGIGEISPIAKLDLKLDPSVSRFFKLTNPAKNSSFTFRTGSYGELRIDSGGYPYNGETAGDIVLLGDGESSGVHVGGRPSGLPLTNNSVKLSVNGTSYLTGNVGINTLPGSDTLTVGGNTAVNGSLKINSSGTRPACTDANRGMMWFARDFTSDQDALLLCVKVAGVPQWMFIQSHN